MIVNIHKAFSQESVVIVVDKIVEITNDSDRVEALHSDARKIYKVISSKLPWRVFHELRRLMNEGLASDQVPD